MLAKNVSQHVIFHSYLCNILCRIFIKIESNCFSKTYSEIESMGSIKKGKIKIALSRDNKDYLCNILSKFLNKAKSTWKCEIKEQTPLLPLLYCGRTVSMVDCFLCLKAQGLDCMTWSGFMVSLTGLVFCF